LRRRVLFILVLVLVLSIGTDAAMAGKPIKTTLEVTITSPSDGLEIIAGDTFTVEGLVTAKNGDAGLVETYVQYAVGEGGTDFRNVDGTTLQILSGPQPQMQSLVKDQQYAVSWTLTGNPATYEIRIYSQGATAKSAISESRTVTILGPPPPPGIEIIDAEHQDSMTGYGVSLGSLQATYFADEVYEILSEEKNTHGTKKPTDDTTDLGWIYVFQDLSPRLETSLRVCGHVAFAGDDTDTAFFVQVMYSGAWKTVLAVTNTGSDRIYEVDIPDDTSAELELRVIDNDRSSGNGGISSLYLDQVNIIFESTQEHYLADLPGSVGRRAMKIGDIDNDAENELVVGTASSGINQIMYYKYVDGVWTEQNIASTNGLVHALTIGDVDNDMLNEVLVGISLQSTEFELKYYKYNQGAWTEYNIANPDVTVFAVAVGDVDNDGNNEVAMGLFGGPGPDYELRYYEYNAGLWTEHLLDFALGECDGIEIADIDHDGNNEVVYLGGSTPSMCYYKFEEDVWIKFLIPNTRVGWEMDTGDVDNDGLVEIAWGNYAELENEVRVYKYIAGEWNEFNVSDVPGGYTDGALGTGVYHVAIGDVDNDGLNELAIGLIDDGLLLSSQTVRYYEYVDGVWVEYNVTDTDLSVEVVLIGDIDNDGMNELVVGLGGSYSWSIRVPELRYYKILADDTTQST